MAEVFATVASGAGLASLGLQLVDCALKLKRFYESVEKAPKALDRLSREINTFALLLRHIDDTRERYSVEDSSLLQESIDLCFQSTEDIVSLSNQLDALIRKHQIPGRIYSVLRMRELMELCADLERGKNSLMLAFQLFDHRTQVQMMDASRNTAAQQSLLLLKHDQAIVHLRNERILRSGSFNLDQRSEDAVRQVDHSTRSSPSPLAVAYKRPAVAQASRVNEFNRNRKPYRFRMPLWFTNTIWEMTASRASGRWEVCLQTYNQRPAYSPIVKHYLSGSVDKVQRMFQDGQASPHDVYGDTTPLELAVLSGSVDMFRFLQTYDFVGGSELLDRALSFWTTVWFDTNSDHSGHNVASLDKNSVHRRLLSIIECLFHDRRTILDDSYDVSCINNHLWACPSEIILRYGQNFVIPLRNMAPYEKFDFLVSRFFSNQITADLFASIVPPVEQITTTDQIERSLNRQPFHTIAIFMGQRINNLASRSTLRYSTEFWRAVSGDPILGQLKALFATCIHMGYNAFACDRDGLSPLRKFLESQRRLIRFTTDLLPIQYWAQCISDAGIDLYEYGTRETYTWHSPIRIGWLNYSLHGYTGRLFATGFEGGVTAQSWHLKVHQVVYIPLYRRDCFPGSWPPDARVPDEICWKPTTAMSRRGERWNAHQVITVKAVMPPLTVVEDSVQYYNLLEGTQDDSLAAARLLERSSRRPPRRRRRASEPFPVGRPQSSIQNNSSAKPWLRGYFHYCHVCCERFDSRRDKCHRWDNTRGTCSEERVWESDKPTSILCAWSRFKTEHKSKPVQCLGFAAEKLVNPLAIRTVDALDIFSYAPHYWFCEEFPNCLHQTSYLDLISSDLIKLGQ